jgi:hypothetical protein
MEDSHPHDGHQAGRLHLGEEEVGGLGLRGGTAITWGRRRGIGAAARVEERGGLPKGWGSEREGAARVKGGTNGLHRRIEIRGPNSLSRLLPTPALKSNK